MREEDVEKLAKRLKAHDEHLSTYSDSELAKVVENHQHVMENFIRIDDSEPRVLDAELSLFEDEHELILVFTPILSVLSQESNLVFVNTEEWKWLHTILEHPDNYLKPDGLSCQKGLYISKDCHRPFLNTLRNENPAEYLFGHGIWEIRDMYKVWEFKTKIAPADRGKAYSYALHLCRYDTLNTYHVILCDATCFHIIEARGGVITTRTTGNWVTAGSKKALLNALMWQNPWERLLSEFCRVHSVTVAGYLGRGLCGRCFKVITGDGSERAMKIVLTLDDESNRKRSRTISEYKCLTQFSEEIKNVVRVEADSLRVVVEEDGCELGVGYLMRDVGAPISREDCQKNSEVLWSLMHSLNILHQQGYHHGDPRVQNAILVSDRVVWIDFMDSCCVGMPCLMRTDLKLLIQSIFGEVSLETIAEYDGSNITPVYDAVVAMYCPK
jgi:tRNA A-37 threonylcarbamoyl transferase component Bud32